MGGGAWLTWEIIEKEGQEDIGREGGWDRGFVNMRKQKKIRKG